MRNATDCHRPLVVTPAAVLALSAALLAAPSFDQGGAVQGSVKVPRIERLKAWIAAVNRHEPGTLDEPVEEVNTWSGDELRKVWIDVSSVVSLVREPSVKVFYAFESLEIPTSSGRPQVRERSTPVSYAVSEVRALVEIAASLGRPGDGRENVLLKRGAMLHADIAMLAPVDRRLVSGAGAGSVRYRLNINDGRPTSLETEVNHWDIGRRLLDRVSSRDPKNGTLRGPGSHQTVRVWYVATCAHLLQLGELDMPHFAHGLTLFSNDPDILFLNAAVHETLAGARRQAAIRAADLPSNVTFSVRSAGEELGEADRLYRRALQGDPEMTEARIRYGRVLGLRGRHQEAVAELQKTSDSKAPLLQYYAALFLAGELEALGKDAEARRQYERAAALFPGAQSPQLGLSRLATGGERVAARDALMALVSTAPEGDARDDPWWAYDVAPGRGADIALAALHKMIRDGQ